MDCIVSTELMCILVKIANGSKAASILHWHACIFEVPRCMVHWA